MKINYNLSAVIANSSLGKAESKLQTSLAKLSSGYRINEAKDDATGMAITRKMREQLDALDKSNINAQDAVSLLQTAEGAISEIQEMLQRMRELTIQSANGTNTETDRYNIQLESDQLVEEIDRLSKDTEFNGMPILDGTLQKKGYTSQSDNVRVDYYTGAVIAKNYSISIDTTAIPPDQLAKKAISLSSEAVNLNNPIPAGVVTINGYSIQIEETDTADEVYEKLRKGANHVDVNLYSVAVSTPMPTPSLTENTLDSAGYITTSFSNTNTSLLFVSEDYGSNSHISISCNNADLATALKLDTMPNYGSVVYGKDTKLQLGSEFEKTATYRSDGDKVTITDLNGFELNLTISPLTDTNTSSINLEITDMGDMSIQVGGRDGQSIAFGIANCGKKALGIDNINITSDESINRSLVAIDKALNRVTEMRASIGAYENRLEATMASIGVTSENMTAAFSRVMDTDMASEMTEYTQQNVITQAATSMLAQANDLPQKVLQLLS